MRGESVAGAGVTGVRTRSSSPCDADPVLVILFVIQFALVFHARHVALAARRRRAGRPRTAHGRWRSAAQSEGSVRQQDRSAFSMRQSGALFVGPSVAFVTSCPITSRSLVSVRDWNARPERLLRAALT